MSLRARRALFAAGALALAVVLVVGYAGLPSFGDFHGAYGTLVAHLAVPERHATGVVSALTFDYRGFDTLGEEFIVLTAVVGVVAILRIVGRGEHREDDEQPAPSTAARAVGLALVGPTVLFGLYVTATGSLTPGGGFQGGVMLSSALLLVFVAGSALALRRLRPIAVFELAEGLGALGLALIGVGGLVFAGTFFENFLGVGTTGSIFSGGIIQVSSVCVGLEVAAGFTLIVSEFLEHDLLRRGGGS